MEKEMVKNEESEVIETVEENGQESAEVKEKTFTQEQVNEIVRKRLEKVKGLAVEQEELDRRSGELTARENKLTCKEYLLENGYPQELLEILDTSDVNKFKVSADKLNKLSGRQQEVDVPPLASLEGHYGPIERFGENIKRKPKGYWATDPKKIGDC